MLEIFCEKKQVSMHSRIGTDFLGHQVIPLPSKSAISKEHFSKLILKQGKFPANWKSIANPYLPNEEKTCLNFYIKFIYGPHVPVHFSETLFFGLFSS